MNKLTIDDIQRDLEAERKSAEIISEEYVAALRDFKKAGVTPRQVGDLTEKLSTFANETFARTLGVVQPKANVPKTDAQQEDSAADVLGGYSPGDWSDNPPDTDPIDNETQKPHNKDMSTVPVQAYLDKSIESIEKRMDDRIARIEKAAEQVLSDNKSFRHTVWTVGITVLLGIGGLIYALTQNMISSFDVGSTFKDNVNLAVSAQNQQINERLSRMESSADNKLSSFADKNEASLKEVTEALRNLNQRTPATTIPYTPRR